MDNNGIEEVVIKLCSNLNLKKKGVGHWKYLNEEELLYELISCILGSQMHFETAIACSNRIKKLGILKNPEKTKISLRKIRSELSKNKYPPFRPDGSGYSCRYYNMKAKYITKTIHSIYKENKTTLRKMLETSKDEYDSRNKLIDLCYGIGHKQASLFLRNISFSRNLVILDSHVLKYMILQDMCTKKDIENISNNYLKIERIFLSYAYLINQPLFNLDIAIWTVMRVMRRENKCQLLH